MMTPLKIFLVCGGGASSGFLAGSMRKDAKKKNLSLEIFARSEAVIEAMKDEIDVLLIGPHLRFKEQELRACP
jgi:PTS system cellobiose-specific IIB component